MQVGANAGESISINKVIDARTTALGTTSTATATAAAAATGTAGVWAALATASVTVNGIDIGPIAAASSAVERGAQVASAVNAVSNQSGVSATVDSAGLVTMNNYGTVTGKAGVTVAGAGATAADTGVFTAVATQTAGAGFATLDLTSIGGAV